MPVNNLDNQDTEKSNTGKVLDRNITHHPKMVTALISIPARY